MVLDYLLAGMNLVTDVQVLALIVLGVTVGIMFGSMPGLTYSMGIILMLPLTFQLESLPAVALLLGVYIGGMTGGSVSAILLGIPGTPSAAATVLDGFQLTKRGDAAKALGTAVFSSILAGLLSLVVLVLVAPQIARIAIKFGPAEIFALVVFGFSTICGVSAGNLLKGLISGVIGLLVMTIGLDPVMGVPRYTFGMSRLMSGVDLLAAMIGMFAIPQIIANFTASDKEVYVVDQKVSASFPSWSEIRRMLPLMIRCALIGIGIGSIPGSGGPIAAFLGYDQAKRKQGAGGADKPSLEGVAGPEAANNGVTGGALIPLLTLGIPGDPATAILLGALVIHGLRPGPLLFKEYGDFVYGVFVAIFLINLATLLIQFFGIRLFVKILGVQRYYLYPTILVLCVVGAFAVNNNFFDVYVMFFAGVMGYLLQKYGFPTTPVILALVLGPTIEDGFRRALILSSGDLLVFVESPVSIIFLSLTVLVLAKFYLSSGGSRQPGARQPKA